MNAFTFPQPGDGRTNAAAIPVPELTLGGLLIMSAILLYMRQKFEAAHGEMYQLQLCIWWDTFNLLSQPEQARIRFNMQSEELPLPPLPASEVN